MVVGARERGGGGGPATTTTTTKGFTASRGKAKTMFQLLAHKQSNTAITPANSDASTTATTATTTSTTATASNMPKEGSTQLQQHGNWGTWGNCSSTIATNEAASNMIADITAPVDVGLLATTSTAATMLPPPHFITGMDLLAHNRAAHHDLLQESMSLSGVAEDPYDPFTSGGLTAAPAATAAGATGNTMTKQERILAATTDKGRIQSEMSRMEVEASRLHEVCTRQPDLMTLIESQSYGMGNHYNHQHQGLQQNDLANRPPSPLSPWVRYLPDDGGSVPQEIYPPATLRATRRGWKPLPNDMHFTSHKKGYYMQFRNRMPTRARPESEVFTAVRPYIDRKGRPREYPFDFPLDELDGLSEVIERAKQIRDSHVY